MATDALTLVARSTSIGSVSVKQVPDSCQTWRQVLIAENPQEIWSKISRLLLSTPKLRQLDLDKLTQEVFLQLLNTGRTTMYVEQGLSDDEIEEDILTLVT